MIVNRMAGVLLAASALLPVLAFADEAPYLAGVRAKLLLKTTQNVAGDPIVYARAEQPEVTALLVEVPAGGQTGWHRHPFPGYGYIIEGEMSMEVEGQPTRIFRAGDAVVKVVNRRHNGRNLGKTPARLVVFFTGDKGQPFTEKTPVP